MPAAIAVYSWTGAYLGLHAGYGRADAGWRITRTGIRMHPDGDGSMVGVHGGINWQQGALVFGLDTSWSRSSIDGAASCPNTAFRCVNEIKWTGDVRGRLGWAFDRVHVYGAAGFAVADVDSGALGPWNYDGSERHAGWTAGLGAEFALTNNVILGVEWKHTDLGSRRHAMDAGFDVTRTRIDLSTDVVQARASYKF